jgi:broad specificity phosphatase PhoE
LLIRHGQYDGDYLTALGRRQARLVAKRIALRGVDVLHVSTMPRALETADFVAARLPGIRPKRAKILCEIIPTRPPSAPASLQQRPESQFAADLQRGLCVLERYFKSARQTRTDAIVCHGNLIRFLLTRVLERPDQTWLHYGIHHCGITELVVGDDGVTRLIAFNDTGHLPHAIRTA